MALDESYIVDLFVAFGPVVVRRMFGGGGIYAEGLMFALVADGVIYLKADAQTIPAFEKEGLRPFTYAAKGRKQISLSYWRMPDRLYDDADELARWARKAVMAAQRSAENKTVGGRRQKTTATRRVTRGRSPRRRGSGK
jgi:DNA transformation protein and related proteins